MNKLERTLRVNLTIGFFFGVGLIGSIWAGMTYLSPTALSEPPKMFYNSVYHTVYQDPATLPCDYPHPSEFTDEQWTRFAKRCR